MPSVIIVIGGAAVAGVATVLMYRWVRITWNIGSQDDDYEVRHPIAKRSQLELAHCGRKAR